MRNYVVKNKISNICTFAAIPGSLAVFVALILMPLRDTTIGTTIFHGVSIEMLIYVCQILYGIALLALVISTFTCGTLGRMFRAAGKAFLGVLRFPVIVLTVMFFVIWFSVAFIALASVLAAGLLCPAGAIAICASNKRREAGYCF